MWMSVKEIYWSFTFNSILLCFSPTSIIHSFPIFQQICNPNSFLQVYLFFCNLPDKVIPETGPNEMFASVQSCLFWLALSWPLIFQIAAVTASPPQHSSRNGGRPKAVLGLSPEGFLEPDKERKKIEMPDINSLLKSSDDSDESSSASVETEVLSRSNRPEFNILAYVRGPGYSTRWVHANLFLLIFFSSHFISRNFTVFCHLTDNDPGSHVSYLPCSWTMSRFHWKIKPMSIFTEKWNKVNIHWKMKQS